MYVRWTEVGPSWTEGLPALHCVSTPHDTLNILERGGTPRDRGRVSKPLSRYLPTLNGSVSHPVVVPWVTRKSRMCH